MDFAGPAANCPAEWITLLLIRFNRDVFACRRGRLNSGEGGTPVPDESNDPVARPAPVPVGLVYNEQFGTNLWSDKKMIRFLQTPGPIKKIVLGGMLIVICIAMLVYLIPSGNSTSGNPSIQSVATVDGSDITATEVRNTARQMAQQQAARYGAQASMIMPFLLQQATQQAADQLISKQILLGQAQHLGLRVTPKEIQEDRKSTRLNSSHM